MHILLLSEHGESVVVLADSLLLELPLEALAVLQGPGISSISRDFSLQVFYTRLYMDEQGKHDQNFLNLNLLHVDVSMHFKRIIA